MAYGRRFCTLNIKEAFAVAQEEMIALLAISDASMPFEHNIFRPQPDTLGSGSTSPATTLLMPFLWEYQ